MSEIHIAHVSVKKSDTSYDLITLHQFLKMPLINRHDLIKKQQIEFIDSLGGKIKIIEGLKAITELIKQLRTDGTYSDFMAREN